MFCLFVRADECAKISECPCMVTRRAGPIQPHCFLEHLDPGGALSEEEKVCNMYFLFCVVFSVKYISGFLFSVFERVTKNQRTKTHPTASYPFHPTTSLQII